MLCSPISHRTSSGVTRVHHIYTSIKLRLYFLLRHVIVVFELGCLLAFRTFLVIFTAGIDRVSFFALHSYVALPVLYRWQTQLTPTHPHLHKISFSARDAPVNSSSHILYRARTVLPLTQSLWIPTPRRVISCREHEECWGLFARCQIIAML